MLPPLPPLSLGPRLHAVMVIIRREDKYLFIKRARHLPAGGFWCPVSGKVEVGETLAQTVERETWEEVGLKVRAVRKMGEMPNSTGDYLLHWWTAEILEGDATIRATTEIEALAWVTPDEFPTLQPQFPEDMDFILRLAAT